jgi:hypothetical protein
MPPPNHLLRRAYLLAEQKKIVDVTILLVAIVQDDPDNIEAWEFFLNIYSRNKLKLEELGEKIKQNTRISSFAKREILAYYGYLMDRVEARETAIHNRRRILLRGLEILLIILGIMISNWVPDKILAIVLRIVAGATVMALGYAGIQAFVKLIMAQPPATKNMLPSYATETKVSVLEIEHALPEAGATRGGPKEETVHPETTKRKRSPVKKQARKKNKSL